MKTSLKSILLVALVAGFLSLFATGCGSEFNDGPSGQFPSNASNRQTTTLLLRFEQALAQTVGTVPNGTVSLRIDLHSGTPPTTDNFIESRTISFAAEVTLENVDLDTKSLRVTAFNAEGEPTVLLIASGIVATRDGVVEVSFDIPPILPIKVGTVPNGTTVVRIDLHSAEPPTSENLIETRTITFDTEITLDDVPPNTKALTATPFDAEGVPGTTLTAGDVVVSQTGNVLLCFDRAQDIPTGTFQALQVAPNPLRLDFITPGSSVQIDLTGVFSDGNIPFLPNTFPANATFLNIDDDVFSISDTGLLTAEPSGGNNPVISTTNVTFVYNLDGVEQQATVEVRTGFIQTDAPFPLVANPNTSSANLNTVFDEGGQPSVDITGDPNLSFALTPTGQGVTVDGNGSVTATGVAQVGDYTLTATYSFGGIDFAENTLVIVPD